jgi:hypothetical protein
LTKGNAAYLGWQRSLKGARLSRGRLGIKEPMRVCAGQGDDGTASCDLTSAGFPDLGLSWVKKDMLGKRDGCEMGDERRECGGLIYSP